MARRKRKGAFALGMVIYAVVFLGITAAGLRAFWNYMDAYEKSRPKNTVDQYVAELTPEDMISNCGDWTQKLDSTIQSDEAFAKTIQDSLTDKITYAKKSSASTETRQTYVLRCGKQVIGEMVISAYMPDRYGFTIWEVASESFDFSHLIGQDKSITVPDSYTVTANGAALSADYITESGIQHAALEEFYDDYEDLPTMVTYTAGSVLGELNLEVLDETGTKVENWEEADPSAVLNNCSAEESAMLQKYMGRFLDSYVTFCSSANQSEGLNYVNLVRDFLIEGSELAHRLYTALDGLSFAQSYSDTIDEVIVNQVTRIDDTHYFCDVTYLVSTYGKAGKVQTTNNMKVMLVETNSGLRVETMTRY